MGNPKPLDHVADQGKGEGHYEPSIVDVECTDSLGGSSGCRASDGLGDVVASQIIPRLMLMRGRLSLTDDRSPENSRKATDDEVIALNQRLLKNDTAGASRLVYALLADGMSLETVYLDLMARAARDLGKLWETDDLSFVDVTIGLSGLHLLLREFGAPSEQLADGSRQKVSGRAMRKALLLPAPGDQHTFGLVLVAEFFRQSHWIVEGGADMAPKDFGELIESEKFDIIGFSLSREGLQSDLACAIEKCRLSKQNASTCVMVGGRVFSEHPALCQEVGADATAPTALDAVHRAENELASPKSMET